MIIEILVKNIIGVRSLIRFHCIFVFFLAFLTTGTGAGKGTFSVIIFLSSLLGIAPMIFVRSNNFFKLVRVPSISRNDSRSSV